MFVLFLLFLNMAANSSAWAAKDDLLESRAALLKCGALLGHPIAPTDEALKGLDAKEGKGFAILDTTAAFPEKLGHELYSNFPQGVSFIAILPWRKYNPIGFLSPDPPIYETEKDFVEVQTEYKDAFKPFAEQIREKIQRVTGDWLRTSMIELRIKRPEALNLSRDAYEWHVDRGWGYTVTVALVGPGTEYQEGKEIFQVPRGHTLIMSDLDRAKHYGRESLGLLHRTPVSTDARLFLTIMYHATFKLPMP